MDRGREDGAPVSVLSRLVAVDASTDAEIGRLDGGGASLTAADEMVGIINTTVP